MILSNSSRDRQEWSHKKPDLATSTYRSSVFFVKISLIEAIAGAEEISALTCASFQ